MNPIRVFLVKHSRILITFLVLAVLGFLVFWHEPQRPLQIAVAKGGRMSDMSAVLDTAANQAVLRNLVLADEETTSLFEDSNFGFLYAFPLGSGESSAWRKQGCETNTCAQVTLYDFAEGGTINAIVNLDQAKVIDRWVDRDARPGASPYIIPRAVAVAATSDELAEIIGDIRKTESLMVPMSTWLTDGDCLDDWCVDLTFLSPDGSGRVLHAVVNMEKEQVSRVFYTRGRADRIYKRPAAQEPFFNDGCHEQYGWSVCWEMTAHDGINFYDATFNGESVFSSVKISQVEVFYPSWPGGYRDEIGYASSVPPYFGTHVTDFDDGFEVSQLYTEFLRWPNCICCYRYEQRIHFYADGSFEPLFISHGPGCDDLSNYRPFWRIDIEVDGPINDEVWRWDGNQWVGEDAEFSMPLFSTESPENGILFTSSGDSGYLWKPLPTDPLGQDDGRLFVLRANEDEGDGPIPTGPADTFWPPGSWLNEEAISGEDIAIWYVPILHTKKGSPWWCMPDPEPDFSPCDAVLRIESITELDQPPTRVPEVITEGTVEPQREPTASPSPAPTSTPRAMLGKDARSIIDGSGCGSCHVIGILGEAGKVGPDLSDIGNTAGQRVPGLSAEDYIRQSIIDPGAVISPRCPNGPCLDGIMPQIYSESLSDEQMELIVSFLLEQRGEVQSPKPTEESSISGNGPFSNALDQAENTSAEQQEGDAQSARLVIAMILTILLFLLLAGIYFVIRLRAQNE